MKLNIKDAPFCSYGSTLVISYIENKKNIEDGLYIRSLQGGDNFISNLFKIELVHNGKFTPYEVDFNPTLLRLDSKKGYIEFVISEDNLMAIRGKGVGLHLSMETAAYDNAIPVGADQWEINSYKEEIKLLLTGKKGQLKVDAPWVRINSEYVYIDILPDEDNLIELFIESYKTSRKIEEYTNFDKLYKATTESFNNWIDSIKEVPEELEAGKISAGYYTWSCTVNPRGYLTRPSIYMSKRYMGNIWSWDNCFNGMALLDRNPQLAWDQIMVFFDKQDESGQIADFMNDVFASWSCNKPPIYGWTIKWFLDRSDFVDEEKIEEIFEPLEKATDWWFIYRDYDNDGIPCYHHGNDSGWDNSTVFKDMPPIKSPDLLGYLILQMDVLSLLAKKIGNREKELYWKRRADQSLEKLIDYFYNGEKFVAKKALTHEVIESDSLLLYMPIVLGHRLPEEIREKLLKDLKEQGKFYGEYGIATERVDSELFQEDGYWRGPIWAPTTMILYDSLKRLGELDFAKDIGCKFCKMASKGGMTENYNPLTGEALKENAFTMTSGVYIALLHELF